MKLTQEELQDYMELLSIAESCRPLVQEAIRVIMSYSDEIKELPEALIRWQREKRLESFNFYKHYGFTDDQAITMVGFDASSFTQLISSFNNAGKGDK